MGDRFYQQQKGAKMDKPGRKLKAEYLEDLAKLIGANIKGLDKLTIETIKQLILELNKRA